MKKLFLAAAFLSICVISSCKKDPVGNNGSEISGSKMAPDNFTFSTTKQVSLDIHLLAPDNTPLKNVPVSIYPADGEEALFKAITNSDGSIKASITVPSYMDTLVVDPQYVGLLRNVKSYISGNTLSCTIGGKNGYGGNIVAESVIAGKSLMSFAKSKGVSKIKSESTVYVYDGPYDESGKPRNLETREVISSQLLEYINYSLPEREDVRTHHPAYLAESAGTVLNIAQESDVWLTYVHEGATYLNTFGYYTYPTGNPPQSPSDIDTIHYVFPNSSAAGSGGGLFTGDKIKLGRFQAGISIGFVLFSNSWDGSQVNNNVPRFYSNSNLNSESDEDLRRHTVVLHNASENLFLIGFEDKPREELSCDHDFNDVVFYAKSNPVTGISVDGIPPLDQPDDADGDGVSDLFDEFPNDPDKAYVNYFPSKTSWGTLAFEDKWPDKGDYDLNDLVINYRYAFISNAQNQVVELDGKYNIAAVGASFENGFGVELPFSPSLVSQVNGQSLAKSYIQTMSNGLEAGQTKAVIIPFDNSNAIIHNPYGLFVNTDKTQAQVYGDTINVSIKFNAPVALETLGDAPFNPFLISNMRRGFEVHLPGQHPTDKADTKLFGVSYDNTNASNGVYYLSKDNSPWALSFMEPFSYPAETNNIQDTYLHFLEWAQSNGTLYPDWYKNTQSGYRETIKIY